MHTALNYDPVLSEDIALRMWREREREGKKGREREIEKERLREKAIERDRANERQKRTENMSDIFCTTGEWGAK